MTEKEQQSLGFIARITLLTSLTALSIDMMLPALPAIGESLVVENSNDLQLVITLFIFGMFFGELFFGPFSDAVGRKKALAVGIFIYCIGSLLAFTASTLELLLVGRIIQGIGVSGPKIISRAMIRDQFEGREMARVFSFIMTLFICIPMIAPALGQSILIVVGWRAIFLVFIIVALLSLLLIMIQQPETLPISKRIPIRFWSLAKTTGQILRHPIVMSYAITAGLIFGVFLLYLSTSQAMFDQIYGKGESFPLYFALLASGFGLTAFLNSKFVMKYGMYRLSAMSVVGLICVGGVFLLLSIQGGDDFVTFMITCYGLMLCSGVIFSNLSAMAMQPLGQVAGLGASIISAISSIIAVPVSVLAGRYFNNTLLPLALTILICGVLSLLFLFIAQRSQMSNVEVAS